ncbi:Cytochrome P460 [Gammaproteobacteria bacterium]
MFKKIFSCWLFALILPLGTWADTPLPSPNGIQFPSSYKDWRVLTFFHRTDMEDLRLVLGNNIAMDAVHQPWPEGTSIVKIVWRTETRSHFGSAIIPDRFIEIGLMIKDKTKFPKTGGWGFAQWSGRTLTPYGENQHFEKVCFGCHLLAKDSDYVFVKPLSMP